MKPIRIVLAPTRSRPLNIFLGLVLLLAALLVFLALATYHPGDPSLNTASGEAGPHAVRNWIGLFGAALSDLLLQCLGISAFLLPLWTGGLGWTWMRSRPGGLAWLRWIGTVLALAFVPAVLALLPWHWRWLHLLPVEGAAGRLMAGLLVTYLNIQGAWLVAGVLAAAGLWFASAISFEALVEATQNRWRQAASLLDSWRNWRERRAEEKEERLAERELQREQESRSKPGPQLITPQLNTSLIPDEDSVQAADEKRPGFFARFFRRRGPEVDPHEIPAFQRAPIHSSDEDKEAATPARRSSIWERDAVESEPPREETAASPIPITPTLAQSPQLHRETMPSVAASLEPVAQRPAPEAVAPLAEVIAIHERADADLRTAAVTPKSVSGFKLPPSTLLNSGDGPQSRPRGRTARRGSRSERKMRRVRRARPGGANQSRPHGDDLRVQARGGRKVLARHRSGRRSLPGHARREHPDRAHGGQEHRWHPGAQPRARDDPPARRDRERDLRQSQSRGSPSPWARTSTAAS